MQRIRPLLLLMLPALVHASNVSFQKDVAYLGPDRAEKMDVYTPKGESDGPRPAVLWIHGGGWVGGNKLSKREKVICKALAEEGYVAFSIDYRLGSYKSKTLPGGGVDVPWPQNIYDCKSALRYIRKESARFGVDPDRIAVAGGSAGGHLALLVGVSGDVDALNHGGLYLEQSNQVACIVDFYGIVEVTGGRQKLFAGDTDAETAENLRLANILTHVDRETPPVFIAHGTRDGTVKLSQSKKLADALTQANVPHTFIEVEGAPHSFDLQPEQMDLRPALFEFLAKHLK